MPHNNADNPPSDPPWHDSNAQDIPHGMADKVYRDKRRRKIRPFNFELDNPRRSMLLAVSQARGISMGATLRQLISAAYTMDCKSHPICASGRECFLPHMHPQPAKPDPHAQD